MPNTTRTRQARIGPAGHDRDRIRRCAIPRHAPAYDRARDLPRLIPLWPDQLEDTSPGGTLLILQLLRRALRAERKRARAGHWSYDLNRHLALLDAYRAECAKANAGPKDGRVQVTSAARRSTGAITS